MTGLVKFGKMNISLVPVFTCRYISDVNDPFRIIRQFKRF